MVNVSLKFIEINILATDISMKKVRSYTEYTSYMEILKKFQKAATGSTRKKMLRVDIDEFMRNNKDFSTMR